MRIGGLLLVALLLRAAPVLAQGIAEEVRATYAFAPHELTTQQIAEKSKVLDAFWTDARSRKSAYLPVLRSELARADASPFFRFDGSMLLLSLSDTPADRRVALGAIALCDLRDIQHTDYFREVHRLASLGEDTTEAALHILSDPEFEASVPQHALLLGQNYALVYMLLPIDHAVWLPRILARMAAEQDPKAQKSLLLVAWYAQTGEADAAITAFANDASKPDESRQYAREMSARTADLLGSDKSTRPTEDAIRAARRETMKRVSDEALGELDEQTAQLIARRKPR
jgi:hypothetical protein